MASGHFSSMGTSEAVAAPASVCRRFISLNFASVLPVNTHKVQGCVFPQDGDQRASSNISVMTLLGTSCDLNLRILLLPLTAAVSSITVSYTHLRAHETDSYLVCRLLLEKKKIP